MSDIKFFFPRNRLTDALHNASPRSVRECLKQADENLRQIAAACLDHVDGALGALEKTASLWPVKPDPAYLASLYDFSVRIIGVASVAGLADLDAAAKSLCDVIDGLTVKVQWDRNPVDVHVRAMRLLRTPKDISGGSGILLNGLLEVRKRFAVEPPPTPLQVVSAQR